MCDVDDRGRRRRASTPRASTTSRKVLHTRGPRRLRRAPPRPAVPRRRLDGLGRPAAPRAPAGARGRRSPWSASTSTCPTPTCRSPRRCAPAASPTTRGATSAGSPPTTARPGGRREALGDVDGICVPGGFGVRGIEGKLGAIRYARENRHPDPRPVPGPAVHGDRVRPQRRGHGGRQLARSSTRDAAPGRRHHGRPDATSSRRARHGRHHAPRALPGDARAGQRRSREAYGEPQVDERHRHRYEVNNAYREPLEEAGLVFSGTSPDGRLVEFVELPADVHPYFVATQAHPEFRSRPDPGAPAVRRPGRLRPWCGKPMDEIWHGPVADTYESHEVVGVAQRFHGAVWDVRSTTSIVGGQTVTRDLVVHPGAVGVIALDDAGPGCCSSGSTATPSVPTLRAAGRAAGQAEESAVGVRRARAGRGGRATRRRVGRPRRLPQFAGWHQRGASGVSSPGPARAFPAVGTTPARRRRPTCRRPGSPSTRPWGWCWPGRFRTRPRLTDPRGGRCEGPRVGRSSAC